MLRRFIEEVETKTLFATDDTILLAVSGGMDSVTMCELFYSAGYKFAIAHCNFRLRGEDSNGDEYFTEDKIKVNLMELELNYSTLVNVDSDIDNMFGNNIFVIDDYIYYYKNNSDKLFRYNKKDNVIEEFNTPSILSFITLFLFCTNLEFGSSGSLSAFISK